MHMTKIVSQFGVEFNLRTLPHNSTPASVLVPVIILCPKWGQSRPLDGPQLLERMNIDIDIFPLHGNWYGSENRSHLFICIVICCVWYRVEQGNYSKILQWLRLKWEQNDMCRIIVQKAQNRPDSSTEVGERHSVLLCLTSLSPSLL